MSKIYDALKRAEREREIARDRGGATTAIPSNRPARNGGQEDDDYRRLRASLLFAPAYSDVRTIAVTATRHGEGATRVAVGLARALAAEGETRVLLVEGNLRTPSFAQSCRCRRARGWPSSSPARPARARSWRRSATGICRSSAPATGRR